MNSCTVWTDIIGHICWVFTYNLCTDFTVTWPATENKLWKAMLVTVKLIYNLYDKSEVMFLHKDLVCRHPNPHIASHNEFFTSAHSRSCVLLQRYTSKILLYSFICDTICSTYNFFVVMCTWCSIIFSEIFCLCLVFIASGMFFWNTSCLRKFKTGKR
jgi:hypothetical protein